MKKFIKEFWVYLLLLILFIITIVTLPIWLYKSDNLSGYLLIIIVTLMCITAYKEIKEKKK